MKNKSQLDRDRRERVRKIVNLYFRNLKLLKEMTKRMERGTQELREISVELDEGITKELLKESLKGMSIAAKKESLISAFLQIAEEQEKLLSSIPEELKEKVFNEILKKLPEKERNKALEIMREIKENMERTTWYIC